MTSKKTRSKYKKARFFGRAFEQVVPTNSEPVAEEFPIQRLKTGYVLLHWLRMYLSRQLVGY
jgi:hypothetical protein